jgi:hypothetical protein
MNDYMGIYIVSLFILLIFLLFTFCCEFFVFEAEIKRGGILSSRSGQFACVSSFLRSFVVVISTILLETHPTIACLIQTVIFFIVTVYIIIFPPLSRTDGNCVTTCLWGSSLGGGIVGLLLPSYELCGNIAGPVLAWISIIIIPTCFAVVSALLTRWVCRYGEAYNHISLSFFFFFLFFVLFLHKTVANNSM